MLPIGDDEGSAHGARLVTIALIALNLLVFFLELGQGSEGALQSFITAWGVVPREYSVVKTCHRTFRCLTGRR